MSGYPGAAPGWYADPAGGPGQRWWDGYAWTAATVLPEVPPPPPAVLQSLRHRPRRVPPLGAHAADDSGSREPRARHDADRPGRRDLLRALQPEHPSQSPNTSLGLQGDRSPSPCRPRRLGQRQARSELLHAADHRPARTDHRAGRSRRAGLRPDLAVPGRLGRPGPGLPRQALARVGRRMLVRSHRQSLDAVSSHPGLPGARRSASAAGPALVARVDRHADFSRQRQRGQPSPRAMSPWGSRLSARCSLSPSSPPHDRSSPLFPPRTSGTPRSTRDVNTTSAHHKVGPPFETGRSAGERRT